MKRCAAFLLATIAIGGLAACAAAGDAGELRSRPVADSLLGVHIGDSLDQAHARLDGLGVNDGRDTRGGGRKESWRLEDSPFTSIALKTNGDGRVVWLSGFVRPESGIPFAELGDLSLAQRSTVSQAIWNVEAEQDSYRLVAKGQDGKASVVYLLSLYVPPIE